MRVVKHWARLPKEVMDVQFLEVFKTRLGKVLSNIFLLEVSLPRQGGGAR